MKQIKKLIFFIVIVLLIGIFAFGAYFTYIDSNCSKAREYLLNKYDINKKEWFASGYTEYVYEDIANCETLWLKKCTSDENLLYTYIFKNKENETITVSEDKNGNFTDDFNGPLKENNEDEKGDVIDNAPIDILPNDVPVEALPEAPQEIVE